jgi:methyltransferase (TIGR00027 family)
MEENQVSHTALIMAYFRGYHAKYDLPRIFNDSLAWKLLGEEKCTFFDQCYTPTLQQVEQADPTFAASCPDRAAIQAWTMQRFLPVAPTVSRARYAEDSLAAAIRVGVRQYIILGAGLDTFAFRHLDVMDELQVFEVDHPATQAFKLQRLADLDWKQPERLHFVPVDFKRESLAAALTNTSYDAYAPSFVSWLGVTFYLTHDEVLATLRTIAGITPPGSRVVFDYFNSDVFIPEKTTKLMQDSLAYTRQHGEPIITGFDPSKISDIIAPVGLRLHENLSPEDIEKHFFQERTDAYHAYEHMHFASVAVERRPTISSEI